MYCNSSVIKIVHKTMKKKKYICIYIYIFFIVLWTIFITLLLQFPDTFPVSVFLLLYFDVFVELVSTIPHFQSCIIKRFCEKRFISKYLTTIGIDYGVTR